MKNKDGLVYGVGVNDSGYSVTRSKIVEGKMKRVWSCVFYSTWVNMLCRCYSQKLHKIRPTYIGCSVIKEWLYFSAFKEWMSEQEYDGKHLDKDILFNGNKVYGPDTCIFISSDLNHFLTDRSSARGECSLGVSWDIGTGKFKAQCNNPFSGKRESIGYFNSDESAHQAWRARKHDHALCYADQQTDARISNALRERFAPVS